jgi:hypothetical protein
MSAWRFREPHFEHSDGNFREPSTRLVTPFLANGRFVVPGTNGNRSEHSGSRYPPTKGGNRYRYWYQSVPQQTTAAAS